MSSSDSQDRSASRKRSGERSRSRDREKERRHGESRLMYISDREKKYRIRVPDLLQPLQSFRDFNRNQTERISQQIIQKSYDRYKKDWEHRQNEQFVNTYKDDAWFNEKYNPQSLDLQEREKKDLAKKNYQDFAQKLKQGYYNAIELRVNDLSQIGNAYEQEEDEEASQNFNNFLSNQTIDVMLDNSINISKAPYFGFDPDHATLFIKGLSKEISRHDIKATLEKIQGWKTIIMSDPLRKANFTRNCWIEFYTEDQCQKALQLLDGIIVKQNSLSVSKAFTKVKRIKVLKNYPSTRLQTDIETMTKLVQKLDAQAEISENVLLSWKFPTLQKQYDTILLYLRTIHYFDYYTCNQFQNERIMTLKIGSIFLRIEADYQELPNTQTVFKKIQQNAENKAEEIKEVPEYSALLREEIDKFVRDSQKTLKDEIKGSWQCPFCEKKFKTNEFLSKHLMTRHDELKNKKLQAVMEQLYIKDPFKITNYYIRDENKVRKNYAGGFRREPKKRQNYRDFDEPDQEVVHKPAVVSKNMVNFLDI